MARLLNDAAGAARRRMTLRLMLSLVSASLLMLAMAYHWQGNVVHEIAGTLLFALVATHNVINRRWYGTLRKRGRDGRGKIDIAGTLLLLAMMSALLVTSLLVSETVFRFVSSQGGDGFTTRQVHAFAGYWVLTLVAVHLGLRWPLLMAVARNRFRIEGPNRARTWMLRAVAASIAVAGANAWSALGVGAKLTLQLSLDWWNFEESAAGFFLHCVGYVGLVAALTYYPLVWLQRRPLTTTPRA